MSSGDLPEGVIDPVARPIQTARVALSYSGFLSPVVVDFISPHASGLGLHVQSTLYSRSVMLYPSTRVVIVAHPMSRLE